MGRKLPTLEKRRRAVDATKDRFTGKAFELGSADCVKLVRFLMVQMGPANWKRQRDAKGRLVRKKLPSTGHYKTPLEAARALKKQGARNVAELLDQYLERIPPAAMLPGDIGLVPAQPDAPASDLGTIVIKVTKQKYMGWLGEFPVPVLTDLTQLDAAWRA